MLLGLRAVFSCGSGSSEGEGGAPVLLCGVGWPSPLSISSGAPVTCQALGWEPGARRSPPPPELRGEDTVKVQHMQMLLRRGQASLGLREKQSSLGIHRRLPGGNWIQAPRMNRIMMGQKEENSRSREESEKDWEKQEGAVCLGPKPVDGGAGWRADWSGWQVVQSLGRLAGALHESRTGLEWL